MLPPELLSALLLPPVLLWKIGRTFSQSEPKQSFVNRNRITCGTEKLTSRESSEIDQGIEDMVGNI
jgi:hypothetical protein